MQLILSLAPEIPLISFISKFKDLKKHFIVTFSLPMK